MINRRVIVSGGPLLLASAVMWNGTARAGLLGKLGKVAGTVVQGVNIATNPAKQIEIATKAVKPLVHQIAPSADRALEITNQMAQQSSTLEGRLKIIVSTMAPQAIPFFVNTGYVQDTMDTYAQTSRSPLELGSSDEQSLIGDPSAFVQKREEYLADYVKRSSYGYRAETFAVPAGGISLNGIISSQKLSPGYYPSILSISDLLTLVSIFRA